MNSLIAITLGLAVIVTVFVLVWRAAAWQERELLSNRRKRDV